MVCIHRHLQRPCSSIQWYSLLCSSSILAEALLLSFMHLLSLIFQQFFVILFFSSNYSAALFHSETSFNPLLVFVKIQTQCSRQISQNQTLLGTLLLTLMLSLSVLPVAAYKCFILHTVYIKYAHFVKSMRMSTTQTHVMKVVLSHSHRIDPVRRLLLNNMSNNKAGAAAGKLLRPCGWVHLYKFILCIK